MYRVSRITFSSFAPSLPPLNYKPLVNMTIPDKLPMYRQQLSRVASEKVGGESSFASTNQLDVQFHRLAKNWRYLRGYLRRYLRDIYERSRSREVKTRDATRNELSLWPSKDRKICPSTKGVVDDSSRVPCIWRSLQLVLMRQTMTSHVAAKP